MPRMLFVQELGVVPVPPRGRGVVPVGGGGSQCCKLYVGSPWEVAVPLLMRDDKGLRLSPGTVDGGVRRLPALVAAVDGFTLPIGVGLVGCELAKGSAGSSMLGRLFAAGLRAVRPAEGAVLSELEAIMGCWTVAAAAMLLYGASRLCPGGLYPSVLVSLGGVGRVFNVCAAEMGVEVAAPGQ